LAYKDKDKQRERTRERVRRFRAGHVTLSEDVTPDVTPLPAEIVNAIKVTEHNRKRLGLSDDTSERLSRAEDYHRWNQERLKRRINQLIAAPGVL